MENQHRKIVGYRELSQAEIDLMNEVKAEGARLRDLIARLEAHQTEQTDLHGTPDAEAARWRQMGEDCLQQGLMFLTRSVALPEFF